MASKQGAKAGSGKGGGNRKVIGMSSSSKGHGSKGASSGC